MNANTLSRSPSRTAGMLLIHGAAGFVVFVVLPAFTARFDDLLERLRERGELPELTMLVMLLSDFWYFVLPVGLAVDAAVFCALRCLLPKRRWVTGLWFGSVLAAIVILLPLIAAAGLLLPVLKMSATI